MSSTSRSSLEPKQLDLLRRDRAKYARATLKEGTTSTPSFRHPLRGAAALSRHRRQAGPDLNMDKFTRTSASTAWTSSLANRCRTEVVAELICGELFRAAGVPASRVSHAVVTITAGGGTVLSQGRLRHGFLKAFFKHKALLSGGFLRESISRCSS